MKLLLVGGKEEETLPLLLTLSSLNSHFISEAFGAGVRASTLQAGRRASPPAIR